ncbi:MAG: flagellar basal body-associated FliL family protein [Ideonella sp.]
MATATADVISPDAPKGKGKGKKKLMVILVALLVLLAAGAAGAFFIMKKNVSSANGEEAGEVAHATNKPRSDHPPTYVALDPFVVNLADKDAERYAQIAVTLEVDDPKFGDQMKGYMPSIRNAILLVLAHKTSQELLDRAGKDALAEEIMRESVRPMGIEIDPEDAEPEADDGRKKRKKRRAPSVHNPVTHVHFANFIIQ